MSNRSSLNVIGGVFCFVSMATWGAYLVGAPCAATITHAAHFEFVPHGALPAAVRSQVGVARAAEDVNMATAEASTAERSRTPTTVTSQPSRSPRTCTGVKCGQVYAVQETEWVRSPATKRPPPATEMARSRPRKQARHGR